jgi:sarcosine oxidase
VEAELAAATAAGATLVRDEAARTESVDGGVRVTARSGRSWTAGRVVLATGAASNATGLLPRPLLMPAFGATIVLVEVDGAAPMPATMYFKMRDARTLFGGIVMPPLPYPDGKRYMKVTGRSLLDNPLDTADEIGRLAAGLAVHGRWRDSIPHEVFRAQRAEPGRTTTEWLRTATASHSE